MTDDYLNNFFFLLLTFVLSFYLAKRRVGLYFSLIFVVIYSIGLSLYYRSLFKFLEKLWFLMNFNVKWWQAILFPFLIIILFKLIDKMKMRIKKTSEKNNKESKIGNNGKEIFRWAGENKNIVGKSANSFTPDKEPNGSFLVAPYKAGRIIGLSLIGIDDFGRSTGEEWNTYLGNQNWAMAVVDQKTGDLLSKGKEINKTIRKDTRLLIYIAKATSFNGKKYRLIIKFSRGPVKKLTTKVPN